MTAITLLMLTGCLVGKAKYESALTEIADLEDQMADLKVGHAQEASTMQGQIDAKSGEIKTLKKALDEAAAQSSQLEAQIRKLQTDMANAIADRSKLRASVAEMEEALADLAKRKAAADAQVARFKDLLSRFQSLIDAGKLQVKIIDGRMVVELATDVLFAKGSAELSADGKAALEEVAVVLAGIEDWRYQVAGHTDNDPISTKQYPSNWELGAGRALVVTKTLIAAGLPATRVSAATYGEQKPAVDNDSPENKSLNRRIEIVVVPDLSEMPGFSELQDAGAE